MNLRGNLLVWIDLEMTGLAIEQDTILEIATVITDNQLAVLARGPSFAIAHDTQTLSRMDEWNTRQHTRSGLVDLVLASTITMAQAEKETLAFISEYCAERTAPLCGNSVWQDRIFLRKYMPAINQYLHYRIIDVSSIKEVARRWYPANSAINFVKTENHRAAEDIEQSIEELKHYRTYFFTA